MACDRRAGYRIQAGDYMIVEVTDQAPSVTVAQSALVVDTAPGPQTVVVTPAGTTVDIASEYTDVIVSILSQSAAITAGAAVTVSALNGYTGGGGGSLPPLEDLTFNYTGVQLTSITGETYTRTLTYNVSGLVETIVDSDTGITQTLTYVDGRPSTRTVS